MKTKNNLTEKKLTKAELEAREKVMKDLKKNKSALVKRYGKDAEAVMYGRATNIAKKMAESENKNRIKELVRKALMQEQDIEVGADKYEGEQELNKVSAIMDDLEDKLKQHDWWYMMSDDHRYYMSGSAQSASIRGDVKTLTDLGYGKEAKELYNKYAPDQLKLTEAKGKDLDKDGDIDSDDYLAARDAAIKKAKGVKEGYYGTTNVESYLEALEYESFEDFFENNPGGEEALMNWIESVPEFRQSLKGAGLLSEDIDLGHEDNEPHMIKGELYQIGKYAMDLYAILEEIEEAGGEYDFPAWWQSKITTAKNMMSSAKHYLDFELKEPAIDAAVDALTGEEPHEGEPMMEAEISAEEKLAAKIAKALKDIANKDASDQHNLKQARIALNKGNIEAAKKIADPYLEEGLPKGFWDKKMKAKDETNESYETLVKKIKGQGESTKAAKAIAGAVAAYKAKGGGKGPTAKQSK